MKHLNEIFTDEKIRESFKSDSKKQLFHDIDDRNYWENIHPDIKEKYVSFGEEYLDFEWKGLRLGELMLFGGEGDAAGCQDEHYRKHTALICLVLAECIENKGRFLPQIIDGIWSMCEETTWPCLNHLYLTKSRDVVYDMFDDVCIDLEACRLASNLAFTYIALKNRLDTFSPHIAKRIKDEVNRRIFIPYLEINDHWWMGYTKRRTNNWNPACHRKILFCIAVLCDDEEQYFKLMHKLIDSLNRFPAVYPEDGACDEGASYWFGAGGMFIRLIENLRKIMPVSSEIYNEPKIKGMVDYLKAMYIGKKYFVCFADSHLWLQNCSVSQLFTIADITKDIQLKELAAKLLSEEKPEIERPGKCVDIFEFANEYVNFLNYKVSEDTRELNYWSDGIEVMVSRQEPKSDEGLFLAAKASHNNESHNHNDIGQFVVYKNSEPVIIDLGIGTYTKYTFDPLHRYDIWSFRSVSHNLPIIDGTEQKVGESYYASDVVCKLDDACDELSMDLKTAYPAEAKINSWKRSVKLDRTAKNIVVSDVYKLDEEKKLEFVLTTLPEPLFGDKIKIGECELTIDSMAEYTVRCEKITLDDPQFTKYYGDTIYQIIVELNDITAIGSMKMTIN